MRKLLVPALVLAALAMPSLAMAAAQTSEVTIKALDSKAMTITGNDGTVYHLASSTTFAPAAKKFGDLKVGAKVSLTWDMMGANHEATQVRIE